MALFKTVLLLAACSALLVDSEAWQHSNRRHVRGNRRNANDATIALGNVGGSEYRALPVLQINGPDVIIGLPDVCDLEDRHLRGSLVVVSNNDQRGQPPQLSAVNKNDPQSNLAIHCDSEDDGSQCANGFTVTTYQFCGDVRTPTTTPASSSESASSASSESAPAESASSGSASSDSVSSECPSSASSESASLGSASSESASSSKPSSESASASSSESSPSSASVFLLASAENLNQLHYHHKTNA